MPEYTEKNEFRVSGRDDLGFIDGVHMEKLTIVIYRLMFNVFLPHHIDENTPLTAAQLAVHEALQGVVPSDLTKLLFQGNKDIVERRC